MPVALMFFVKGPGNSRSRAIQPLRSCTLCDLWRYRSLTRFYCVGFQESYSVDGLLRRCLFFSFCQLNADQVRLIQQRIARVVHDLPEFVPSTDYGKADLITRVLMEKADADAESAMSESNTQVFDRGGVGTTALVTSGAKSQFEILVREPGGGQIAET